LCYALKSDFVKRNVEFTPTALKALAKMGKVHRRLVLDGIRVHLIDNDPLEVTRNKFPLKRPSDYADRELRLDNWRVFYTVMDDRNLVVVRLIGEKRGNKLIIEGEEFEL
jgi:mRNA-degrading endonuclease RelE of RelBE toxin-antitoxin system